ncbi:hypothetical protein [Hymenobacter sp.]|jgi:uncharacterized delta-60 repeat protein|uniref:hypothetical protein n=1 Tax=Hymenobacter sp. TaxID=1898978 RepID=UPI002EDB493D
MVYLYRFLAFIVLCALGGKELRAQPGSLDASFNSATTTNDLVSAVAVQPDGKVIVGGLFSTIGGATRRKIARLLPTGAVDTSFDPGTGFSASFLKPEVLVFQPDGKLLVGGDFTDFNGTTRNRILRLNPDGSYDTSFTTGTGFNFPVKTIVVQTDGKIVVGGEFSAYNGVRRIAIARLNANGTLDPTFAASSTNEINGSVYTIVPLASGKYLIGGSFICIGTCTNPSNARRNLARLNADGTLDTSFVPAGTSFNARVHKMVLQPDGKILCVGTFDSYNGVSRRAIVRLNADATLDNTFTVGTGSDGALYNLRLFPNGQILVSGGFLTYNGTQRRNIALLHSNGALDPSFGDTEGLDNTILDMAMQRNGQVMVVGTFTNFTVPPRTRVVYVARLNGSIVMGTGSPAARSVLGVYPNPAYLTLTIRLPSAAPRINLRLSLLDATGRTVFAQPLPAAVGSNVPVEIGQHPAGLYLLRLEGPDGFFATQPLLLREN